MPSSVQDTASTSTAPASNNGAGAFAVPQVGLALSGVVVVASVFGLLA
jgi:hypothetical protein